jgi:hypothetical protein
MGLHKRTIKIRLTSNHLSKLRSRIHSKCIPATKWKDIFTNPMKGINLYTIDRTNNSDEIATRKKTLHEYNSRKGSITIKTS